MCWIPLHVEDAIREGFRIRQLHAVMRLVPYFMVADCINAILLYGVFRPALSFPLLFGWCACVFCVAVVNTAIWWYGFRKEPRQNMTKARFRLAVVPALATSALFGGAANAVFAEVSPDAQMVLIALVAGLISAGALMRATVPPAAFAWLLPLNLAAAYSISHSSLVYSTVILALLASYDIVIVIAVLSMSRMFLSSLVAEADAARQEQVVGLLLRDFETHASNWLWECDADGRLSRVSARMAEVLGRTPEQLLDVELGSLLGGGGEENSETNPSERQFLECRLAVAEPFQDHVVPVALGEELRWWSLTATPVFDADAEHIGWRGVGADITEARRYDMELRFLAKRDALTGIANRDHFLRSAIGGRATIDQRSALMLIDLDNFKAINDTLGHGAGDALLKTLADRFETCVGPRGLLARLGGDEFALLESGFTSLDAVSNRSMALLETLREPFHVADARVEVRASIGVALAPDHGLSTNQLLQNADAALYDAKESGGNCIRLYDDSLGQKVQRRLEIIRDLGHALKEGQFVLYYQPQVDSVSGRVIAFEALLRWFHPRKGMVMPDQFIPVAEETGQIIAIGAWVLDQACRDALIWNNDLTVAVNLSAVQLNSRTIVETVCHALEASGLPARRLELEVTESALVKDNILALATLNSLHAMRIAIALDDFGTGYSMLSYLRNFPFDKLKIDRSFVMTLTEATNNGNQAIFRAIVDLAAALNLRTVAEGVDSMEKLQAVRDYRCNDVQGYLVARPMPASDVPGFLENWKSW